MRLDKYLADMNLGSRSQVKDLIKAGKVMVNGKVANNGKDKVNENDNVIVNGQKINYQKYHYFLLNKPQDVISATEDLKQKTVLDLLKPEDRYKDLAPVGRLDKDTTGLLLITNDGQLNHDLLSPKKHVDKVYMARIEGIVTSATIEKFLSGLVLSDGTKLKSAKLEVLFADGIHNQSIIKITISEGKYHQIKRMFLNVGMKVLELDRIQMGKLKLDQDLKQGQYRELGLDEVKKI